MSRPVTFGIVGGYGSTGRAVVSELLKSAQGQIFIAGRDLTKASALATECGARVSAARLDVLDPSSLDDFCSRCSIVINCAGPVAVLQDRVAQAALRSRSHYVDVAGLTFVKERLLPRANEIAGLGLSFVISAGWMPGISELVPAYANAVARKKMDAIESLAVYFTDSGEWSDNAFRDGVWYIREVQAKHRTPSYFHQGERTRAQLSAAWRTVDLGEPIGRRSFSLVSVAELDEIGRRLKDCDVFIYSYLSGLRNALAWMMVALLPLPEQSRVRLLRNMFRRNRLPVDGFAVAQIVGRSQGRKSVLTSRIVYRDRRDYWINGLVPATMARLITEGKGVKAGVNFLADAVDPVSFMAELRKAGVEQSEEFKVCEQRA
jgi:hypothetical protein